MKDDKILERVRRLLAMAGDTSSPNEAAIAAGRARKLMDKHQVSKLDLKTTKDEDFGQARYPVKKPGWPGVLAIAMAWLNDVNVKQTVGKRNSIVMEFSGYLVDAVTAKELYLYLLAQADVQADKQGGRKEPFKQGFASGVQAQVREIMKERESLVMSDGRALVVSKRAMVEERYGAMRTSRSRPNSNSTNYQAGYAAGKQVGLNRQVSGSGQARLR